jgi:hypothetical protein
MRELAKKQKQEEKRLRKLTSKQASEPADSLPSSDAET